ncbi:hypothetical protein EVC30_113 [Rhizobium phage RHph_Y1_11]|nr:hypothetical protein EVC30_113 [Rhizobium phage RHph_Y1_11]
MVGMKNRWWPGADNGLSPTGRAETPPAMQHISPSPEAKATVQKVKAAVVKDLSALGDALRNKE